MCLTHCVVKERFDINPKMKAITRRVNVLRELFHMVDRTFIKYLCLFSGMLSVRFLALVSTPNSIRVQDRVVLKHLSMKSGIWRT